MRAFVIAAALALAACGGGEAPTQPAPEALDVRPNGPPETVTALADAAPPAQPAQQATLQNGATVYSADGDTFIARQTETGWRIFHVGAFDSWSVAEDRGEDVVLAVSRAWRDNISGELGTIDEYVIVAVPGPEATTITVTPAS